jgi:hypothetical protein
MPNPNAPFGFRPITRLGGLPLSLTEYAKPATDANAIFAFDLVGFKSSGTPPALPENGAFTVPVIQTGYQLTPGTSLWLGASLGYGAASTATVHPVVDAVDTVFITQCSGATVITNTSHAHKNANVSVVTAGSTTTKQSAQQVDSATIATTSSLDLRIIRVAMLGKNAETANAIVEVTINKHALGLQTAGV